MPLIEVPEAMAPIPTFPTERRLAIDDRLEIEAITRQFPHFSDFGFTSLWCWDTGERCLISRLDDTFIVRFQDYVTGESFYSVFGDRAIGQTVPALLNHARRQGLPARLGLVPEVAIAADVRLPDLVVIAEDRDNDDYVYAVDEWADLPGGAFREHRRKIRRLREGTALDLRSLALDEPAVQEAMITLCHRWDTQKPAEPGDNRQAERRAIERLFLLPKEERVGGLGVFAGADLIAFSISEGLPGGEEAVIHFQKTDRAYRGLASFLCHEEGRRLRERGYRFVNLEQDLGHAGLRAFKRSLQPRCFRRKYVILESAR